MDASNKKLLVKPKEQYNSGEIYKLLIKKDLQSKTNNRLKQTIIKRFKIINDSVETIKFEKSYFFSKFDLESSMKNLELPSGVYYATNLNNDIKLNTERKSISFNEYDYISIYIPEYIKNDPFEEYKNKKDEVYFKIINLAPGQSVELFPSQDYKIIFYTKDIIRNDDEFIGYYSLIDKTYYSANILDNSIDNQKLDVRVNTKYVITNFSNSNLDFLIPYYEKAEKTTEKALKFKWLNSNENLEITSSRIPTVSRSETVKIKNKNEIPFDIAVCDFYKNLNLLSMTSNQKILDTEMNVINGGGVSVITNKGKEKLLVYGVDKYLNFQLKKDPAIGYVTIGPRKKIIIKSLNPTTSYGNDFYIDYPQSIIRYKKYNYDKLGVLEDFAEKNILPSDDSGEYIYENVPTGGYVDLENIGDSDIQMKFAYKSLKVDFK